MEYTPRRKLTREFKLEAVRQAALSEKPKAQLARELGVRVGQLRTWRLEFEKEAVTGIAKPDRSAAEDLEQLRRENAKLKMEIKNAACRASPGGPNARWARVSALSRSWSAEERMKYVNQAEAFSTARRSLMLPHPRGEQDSIARAFQECRLGLNDLDRDGLDENARGRVTRLEELMATAGFSDASRAGAEAVKARELSLQEKFELSRIIDELAYWFRQKCLSSAREGGPLR